MSESMIQMQRKLVKERELSGMLEAALERMVDLANNDGLWCNYDEVIHAEAVLEQIYKARATPVPAPAVLPDQFRDATKLVVPDDWRNVMKELADDAEQSLLIQYSDKERYPSLMLKFNNDMEIVNRARALLQSAPQSDKEA